MHRRPAPQEASALSYWALRAFFASASAYIAVYGLQLIATLHSAADWAAQHGG